MEEIEGFGDFWKSYPRKRDKITAQKMYVRSLKIATSAEILHGARLYAMERAGKDETFTKHPATWLNAGAWMNYPKPTEQKPIEGVYVAFCDPAREAWDNYGRQTKGNTYPKDRAGGWWFPTRWPPNQQEHAP